MSSLIQKPAPDFTAQAVMDNDDIQELTLSKYLKGSYGLVFFYPLDFTFVCPSEILAFDHRMDQFRKLNTLGRVVKDNDALTAFYQAEERKRRGVLDKSSRAG